MTLLVSLWLREGGSIGAFDRLEHEAALLLARHGGVIERRMRAKRREPDEPFEVHIVRFDAGTGLEEYLADPDVIALRTERARIIAKTTILEIE